MSLESCIKEYLTELDNSVSILSHMDEGATAKLPKWVLANRKITIGKTITGNGIVIRFEKDESLEEDKYVRIDIKNKNDVDKIISPMKYSGPPINMMNVDDFILISDFKIIDSSNPLTKPSADEQQLIGWGREEAAIKMLSPESAKKDALNFWNSTKLDIEGNSYEINIKAIIERLQSLIKQKSFLERRIHRYMNAYSKIILPAHKKCHFEHDIFLGTEKRTADFILERDSAFPALLIELEAPIHKVFTKSGDLTKEVNHARRQISEWVQFIDSDSKLNCSDGNEFLSGPKERLIIIGRGLENKEKLLASKFDGTILWTYEMLIYEAKLAINESFKMQCEMIKLEYRKIFLDV